MSSQFSRRNWVARHVFETKWEHDLWKCQVIKWSTGHALSSILAQRDGGGGGIGFQLCEGFWWSLGQNKTFSNDFPPLSRFLKKRSNLLLAKVVDSLMNSHQLYSFKISCGLIQAQGSLGEITPGFWTKTSNQHVPKGTKDVQFCRLYQNSTPVHGTNHLLMFVAAPVQLAVPGSVPQGEEMKIDTTRLLVVEKSMFSFDS